MIVYRFFRTLRLALWRAFEHDALGVAKGAAYSSILSLFPALLVVASVLATSDKNAAFIQEISNAVSRVVPPGAGSTVRAYFINIQQRPIRVLIWFSLLTLWTGSGVMMSWMEGFRTAYALPKTWGMVKERLIAFSLVVMAGIPLSFATILVAFGNQIENRLIVEAGRELGWYILVMWTLIRWIIAILTSVAVIALIYHNAVPRTQPWPSVLPGAALATAVWFSATALFGTYVRHFAPYSLVYGSLAAAIALLVWMYIVSVIVLIGAEFNALLYPRVVVVKRPEPIVEDNPRAKAR
jgi:membrane protein